MRTRLPIIYHPSLGRSLHRAWLRIQYLIVPMGFFNLSDLPEEGITAVTVSGYTLGWDP